MAIGPGKYDPECTDIRTRDQAEGVILIVIRGVKGSGFSCQATPEITFSLPQILRNIADDIERSGIRA
jgi:hypothetical protein